LNLPGQLRIYMLNLKSARDCGGGKIMNWLQYWIVRLVCGKTYAYWLKNKTKTGVEPQGLEVIMTIDHSAFDLLENISKDYVSIGKLLQSNGESIVNLLESSFKVVNKGSDI
jgi:hypothetical protein